jgi:hypothetical protein
MTGFEGRRLGLWGAVRLGGGIEVRGLLKVRVLGLSSRI